MFDLMAKRVMLEQNTGIQWRINTVETLHAVYSVEAQHAQFMHPSNLSGCGSDMLMIYFIFGLLVFHSSCWWICQRLSGHEDKKTGDNSLQCANTNVLDQFQYIYKPVLHIPNQELLISKWVYLFSIMISPPHSISCGLTLICNQ